MERVAIVFDNRPRRETTGVYCRRALGQLMSEGADIELLFRDAMLTHERGQLEEAVELYLQLLKPAGTRHFCSRDVDLTGTKTLHNLAIVYEQFSRWELAQSTWEEILANGNQIASRQKKRVWAEPSA